MTAIEPLFAELKACEVDTLSDKAALVALLLFAQQIIVESKAASNIAFEIVASAFNL
jgi:hypothetical protein